MKADIREWLENQCNRRKNGVCRTLWCLKRGGYKQGEEFTDETATCEAHEILCELESKGSLPATGKQS